MTNSQFKFKMIKTTFTCSINYKANVLEMQHLVRKPAAFQHDSMLTGYTAPMFLLNCKVTV